MNDKEFLEKHFAVGDRLEAEVEKLNEALKTAPASEKDSITDKLFSAKRLEKEYLLLANKYDSAKTMLELAKEKFPWDIEDSENRLENRKQALQEFIDNKLERSLSGISNS